MDYKQCVKLAKHKQELRASIPHRPHDKHCPHNRKTRGMSEMTVFVMKEAERNIRLNNMPFVRHNDPIDPAVLRQFFYQDKLMELVKTLQQRFELPNFRRMEQTFHPSINQKRRLLIRAIFVKLLTNEC